MLSREDRIVIVVKVKATDIPIIKPYAGFQWQIIPKAAKTETIPTVNQLAFVCLVISKFYFLNVQMPASTLTPLL